MMIVDRWRTYFATSKAASATGRRSVGQTHIIGDVAIRLHPESRLIQFMHRHPQYDRFMPQLASLLEDRALIVDVGANVGDTIAAVISRCPTAQILGVDADSEIFELLRDNVTEIERVYPEANIQTLLCLVGDNLHGSMKQTNGTSMLLEGVVADSSRELRSQSLDDVVRDWKEAAQSTLPVRVLKTDVDGYDYNVLLSGAEVLRSDKPIVFYESQTNRRSDVGSYLDLYDAMISYGYKYFYAFDNFGGYMMRLTRESYRDAMLYIHRQNEIGRTRTLWYMDILVCAEKDVEMVKTALCNHEGYELFSEQGNESR